MAWMNQKPRLDILAMDGVVGLNLVEDGGEGKGRWSGDFLDRRAGMKIEAPPQEKGLVDMVTSVVKRARMALENAGLVLGEEMLKLDSSSPH
ncbi:unnamed protein product [Arabis nemorensis]|uniref:Uncharacterized protein n=1 Tax=Arabis nemorensis TaxID=586526 RepID=A0A565CPJ4_9BRAS|nr:unnamed protein product [Arabis nemorensis]